MNISLTPELEQLVTDKVKTGMYQTASEVIREGLRLLRERDLRLEALRRDVRAGFEAAERGEFTDYAENNMKALGRWRQGARSQAPLNGRPQKRRSMKRDSRFPLGAPLILKKPEGVEMNRTWCSKFWAIT